MMQRQNGLSKLLGLIGLMVLIGLAVLSNPSADKHRQKIKAAVAERSQLESMLGVGHLTAFASSYHSLGVVSYTKVGDKTTSFGVLGMVFVAE